MHQLIGINGKLLSTRDIVSQYDISTMQANNLLSLIPKNWLPVIQGGYDNEEDFSDYLFKVDTFRNVKKPTAYYYNEMNLQHGALGYVLQKWTSEIEVTIDDIETAFHNIYTVSNYTN